MKQSIEWHEECLKNQLHNLKRMEEEFKLKGEKLMQSVAFYRIYERQIVEAKRRGKDGFDSDKFLKQRSKIPPIVKEN